MKIDLWKNDEMKKNSHFNRCFYSKMNVIEANNYSDKKKHLSLKFKSSTAYRTK